MPRNAIKKAFMGSGKQPLDKSRVKSSTTKSDAPAPDWADGLKKLYDSVVDEPLPDNFKDLLAKLDEANAQLALYKDRLAKTVIRAPFSGVSGLRKVSPGDVVQPGQELVNLEDIHLLKLDFQIPILPIQC